MRLFGILLIFANLLAGAGFVFLATQDWKGRQTINAAGLRHLLLIQGLPLEPPPKAPEGFDGNDETPFEVEMGGGESTKTVSKKLLESYFQANTSAAAPIEGAAGAPAVALATNVPVTNQIAEVKRVQGVIKAALAQDNLAPADRIALLRRWVLYQAETYELRAEYLALTKLTTPTGQAKTPDQLKADAATLEKALDDRFAAVLAKPQPIDSPSLDAGLADKDRLAKSAAWRAGATRDEAERRLRVAHLLVHLDQDAAWQKRAMVVVGLRRYVQAIANQVARFADMIRYVDQFLPQDQAVFAKEEQQLRERATQSMERAKAIAEIRATQTEQKIAEDDAVNRQRTALKELTNQLLKFKAEVDELLVRQSGLEKQLFEIQREVALTLEEVYRLEALLANTERERYGLPPEKP